MNPQYQQGPPAPMQSGAPHCIGELRLKVQKAENVPGDTTFVQVTPFIQITVGQTQLHTPTGTSKNPIWDPPIAMFFDMWSNSQVIVQIWEKATTALGTTRIKQQGAIPADQFSVGGKPENKFFVFGSTKVFMEVQLVDETTARTALVSNLREGTTEQHIRELFGYIQGESGVTNVLVDPAHRTALVECGNRGGYFQLFQMNGKFELKIEPAPESIEKHKNKTPSLTDFKNDPKAATKQLVGKIGSLFK